MDGPCNFFFLNEPGDLDVIDWDGPERGKLWRYNQHYFDDLNSHKATERRKWHQELIDKWILDNPPRAGIGWESYPTSIRIVNSRSLADNLHTIQRLEYPH